MQYLHPVHFALQTSVSSVPRSYRFSYAIIDSLLTPLLATKRATPSLIRHGLLARAVEGFGSQYLWVITLPIWVAC